jgi:hypothetical protein
VSDTSPKSSHHGHPTKAVLTAVLVLLAIAAGFAVDRFAFGGEFVRMAIAEARLIRSAGRR